MATVALSDSQVDCLWALALGSNGCGAHAGTLASLRRRGLARVIWSQGEKVWEATDAGHDVVDAERGDES